MVYSCWIKCQQEGKSARKDKEFHSSKCEADILEGIREWLEDVLMGNRPPVSLCFYLSSNQS